LKLFLNGLDGANPLGFLAAIGVLKTATDALKDEHIKMGWSSEHGSWRPVICISKEMKQRDANKSS